MSAPARQWRPFELTNVSISDQFWAPRIETNRRVTLPHEYVQLKDTGRIDAFRLQWKPGDPNPPHIFWDSDVTKWIEAAAYSLATQPDARLAKRVDDTIALVASAQQPDGYLNTHFTVVEPGKRWTNLRDQHELYCAGHLIEAAVAYYQATGKGVLLGVARRFADHIATVFGPHAKRGYPGHEELELALVKLYRTTGEERYLQLSRFFIDERGRQPHYFNEEARARGEDPAQWWARNYSYSQCHVPVREQDEVVGHAVRAMYLYCGMADVAAETGDEGLLAACQRLWASAVERKLYVTGAIGARRSGEAFGAEFELPNETAYAETCAAIGLVMFAQRMLEMEADGRYADVLELALYNGILAGVSLDGTRFFYENPLSSAGGHHRQEWFGCACCPPNLARLLAALGSYVYAATPDGVAVNLYAAGSGRGEANGRPVTLTQQTHYPWDGTVRLTVEVEAPTSFALRLRIPGWCAGHKLRLNGKRVAAPVSKGYARLQRRWRSGDEVELTLAMPVQQIAAHPHVADDAGRVALQRGPLVYCLEQCDHKADVRSLLLPKGARLTTRFAPKLLGGVAVVEGTALAPSTNGWKGRLYQPVAALQTRPVRIRAIPYYAWDNRAPGAMAVWLPRG